MVVILQNGTEAGLGWEAYLKDPEVEKTGGAFWVRGTSGTLSSSGFGSCVGLVLYGDIAGYGAVAHFWHPSGKDDAVQITDDYMRWLYAETRGYAGDDVQALVFGGTDKDESIGQKLTQPRMKAIKDYLENRWDMYVAVGKKGSARVTLNLDGEMGPIEEKVTLENGSLSSKPHDMSVSDLSKTRNRSSSFGKGGTGRKRSGSG